MNPDYSVIVYDARHQVIAKFQPVDLKRQAEEIVAEEVPKIAGAAYAEIRPVYRVTKGG